MRNSTDEKLKSRMRAAGIDEGDEGLRAKAEAGRRHDRSSEDTMC